MVTTTTTTINNVIVYYCYDSDDVKVFTHFYLGKNKVAVKLTRSMVYGNGLFLWGNIFAYVV